MISAHAPAFVCHQIPYRQEVECALLLDANHALCHVCTLLRFDEVKQRMLSTIGVPKREDCVVREALSLMDFHVVATILAIHIHIDAWVNHGVVERGIEECLLVVCTFNLESCEFLGPELCCFCLCLLEREAGCFCFEVGKGTTLADGRERNLDCKFVIFRHTKLEVCCNLTSCHVGEVVVDVVLAPEA